MKLVKVSYTLRCFCETLSEKIISKVDSPRGDEIQIPCGTKQSSEYKIRDFIHGHYKVYRMYKYKYLYKYICISLINSTILCYKNLWFLLLFIITHLLHSAMDKDNYLVLFSVYVQSLEEKNIHMFIFISIPSLISVF